MARNAREMMIKHLSDASSRISPLIMTFVVIGLLQIANSESVAQWINVTPDSNVQYNQIIFTDSLRGYIAANSVQYTDTSGAILFITTDGGKSWKENKVNVPWFSSVSAIGDSLVWVSSYNTVGRSKDGGKTWRFDTVASFPLSPFTVQFVDTMNGWVTGGSQNADLGGYEAICHSSNGGLTWQTQYADSGFSGEYRVHQKKGYFVDSLHGWVADYYAVRRTTDAGATWNAGLTNDYMYSAYFLDTLRGWATGYISFYRTTDGGINWVESPGDTVVSHSAILTSVCFADTANGWICDNYGRIYLTTDGGLSLSIQRSDSSFNQQLNSIFFIDKNNGWAVGNGVILHTMNGRGTTAVRQPLPRLKSFRLMQNFPNPFNPTTAISYELALNSFVRLNIYDVLGKQVASFVNEKQNAGLHTVKWDASTFPSGIYFYKITFVSNKGGSTITKKMILIK
jgi:photosystem II stability/assembly factor-like uncharacterized protein